MKGLKKINTITNKRKSRVAVLILNKDFRTRNGTRDQRRYFIMIKRTIYQKD